MPVSQQQRLEKAPSFSVSQLHQMLNVDRTTLKKRLAEKKVSFEKGPRNAKLYNLIETIRTVPDLLGLTQDDESHGDGIPKDANKRKAYFDSKAKELKYLEDAGELMPAEEVIKHYAELLNIFTGSFAELVEALSEDGSLSKDQAKKLQGIADSKQSELQQRVIDYGESVRLREYRQGNN